MDLPQSPTRIGFFKTVLPRYQATQEELARRLAQIHAHSVAKTEAERNDIEPQLYRRIERFGCEPSRLARRFFEVSAFLDPCKSTQTLTPFTRETGWVPRMEIYREALDRAFSEWYPEQNPTSLPQDLIHVSCTGYIAPSPAQTRLAKIPAGQKVRVTHAYHMGCYAALPALRLAEGMVRAGSKRVDITHTELCTLHLQPGRTEPEQLVIQSLFADGHIRWSLLPPDASLPAAEHYLELLNQSEMLLPESAQDMSWNAGETGWQMTLSRDVPTKIRDALPGFVDELLAPHGLKLTDCIAAIHPGGPRIIDEVASVLGLSEEQTQYSRKVLLERGNMSSATLPHIWEQIALSQAAAPGQPILSLAFGPGLTLCGALLRKQKADQTP
jgi:predicted naringenin-chalcone synthase